MGSFRRKGSHAGEEVDQRTEELLRQLPAAFSTPPEPAAASRHLAAITEAAHAEAHREQIEPEAAAGRHQWRLPVPIMNWRNAVLRNRPMIIAVKLGASVLAFCAVTAGIAGAGVTLPEPARGVAAAVGLPNQAEENSADAARDAEGRQDADVRQDADARSHGKSDEAKDDGDDVSAQQNGGDTGIGDDVSNLAQGLGERMRNAGSDEERRQIGQEFSQQVQTWAKDRDRLPEQAQDAPQQNGETEAQGGPETGQDHSQNAPVDGQEVADQHRPDNPGGGKP